jgi:hypothetical protein
MDVDLQEPDADYLILADRAEVLNGKLYMMGGAFDQIGLLDLQQPVPLYAVLGLIIPWNHANRRIPLVLQIEDEDGGEIFKMEAAMVTGRPPDAIPGQAFRSTITTAFLCTFPKAGSYRISARFADTSTKKTVLHVRQVQPVG